MKNNKNNDSKLNPDCDKNITGKENWKDKEEAPIPITAKTNFSQEPIDESKKILSGILGIVIPGFGIHNFIYGYTLKGIIQVIFYVVGILTACLGIDIFLITGLIIWCIVESVLILTGEIKPAPKR